jgi:asparagine synthase (glutamine-hydrolysing)
MPRAPRFLRAKAALQALTRDTVGAYFHEISLIRDAGRERLFSSSLKAALGGYSTLALFHEHAARAQTDDRLALVQFLDMNTYLVGDINTKVDRTSMANSLEVREPLMDHELIEWMATLPSHLKIRDAEGKYLLKKAMEPSLSREILYRRKMGFAVPLAAWFRGPLRDRALRLGASTTLLDCGCFNRGEIQRLVSQHVGGTHDHSAALWALLMFEAFLERTFHETERVAGATLSRSAERGMAAVG